MKRKFWEIAEALFRISWMTNSFKYRARRSVLTLHFSTGPSKLFKFPEIVRPPSSVWGLRHPCVAYVVLVEIPYPQMPFYGVWAWIKRNQWPQLHSVICLLWNDEARPSCVSYQRFFFQCLMSPATFNFFEETSILQIARISIATSSRQQTPAYIRVPQKLRGYR